MKCIFASIAVILLPFTLLLDKEIKGVVVDMNEPLPFATVQVQGTTIGTMTDFDGNFTLNIPEEIENVVLLVRYLGYIEQEVSIGGEESIKIELKSQMTLERLPMPSFGVPTPPLRWVKHDSILIGKIEDPVKPSRGCKFFRKKK